jgi:hypothetical protein
MKLFREYQELIKSAQEILDEAVASDRTIGSVWTGARQKYKPKPKSAPQKSGKGKPKNPRRGDVWQTTSGSWGAMGGGSEAGPEGNIQYFKDRSAAEAWAKAKYDRKKDEFLKARNREEREKENAPSAEQQRRAGIRTMRKSGGDPGGGYKDPDQRAYETGRYKEEIKKLEKRVGDARSHLAALQKHKAKHKGTSNWNSSDERELKAKVRELEEMEARLEGMKKSMAGK